MSTTLRAVNRCWLLFFFFGLCSCSQWSVKTPIESRPTAAVELNQTPFFSQRRKQCGAASLATVLGYHGLPITAAELEPRLYIPGKEGSLAIEITAQARQFGMLAYPLAPDINQLLAEIEAGYPVLVMQNLGLSWLPQWHFAVVIGYDLDAKALILRSGNERRKLTALKTFQNTWRRAANWALVITPAGQIPATATASTFLKATTDLEQVSQLKAASRSYLASLDQWPDDPEHSEIARLGLANVAYKQKQFAQAQYWLKENLQANPQAADSWNNLAYALMATQCQQAAEYAIACAVRLKPESTIYPQSQAEISAASVGKSMQCSVPRCPVTE